MKPKLSKNAQLTGIIFCLPDFHTLEGEKMEFFDSSQSLDISSYLPEKEDFHSCLVNTTIELTDVPNCFGNPPFQKPLTWHLYPQADELGEIVQYQFSDGYCISAREILYHDYSLRVPKPLLPLISKILPEISDIPWLFFFAQPFPQLGDLRKTELALFSILLRIKEFKQNHPVFKKLKIYFTHSLEREKKRKMFLLEKIEFIAKNQPHWILSPEGHWETNPEQGWAQLKFKEKLDSPKNQIFQKLEINPKTKTLFFHPYDFSIKIVQKILSNETPVLSMFLSGHSYIENQCRKIDHELSKNKFPLIQRVTHQIPFSDIKFHLYLNLDGNIQIKREFYFQDKKFSAWNFSSLIQICLRGLNLGLGNFNELPFIQKLNQKKYTKKIRDQEILNHRGLFSYILLEVTSYFIKNHLLNNSLSTNFEEFQQNLLKNLGNLLLKLEEKAGFTLPKSDLQLEKLCSHEVIEGIKSCIDYLLQASKQYEYIYTQEGEFRLKGGMWFIFHFFNLILKKFSDLTQQKCFLKARLSIFPEWGKSPFPELQILTHHPCIAYSYRISHPWLKPSNLLSTLLPLHEKGIQLYYDHLPIYETSIHHFQVEFNLKENSSGDRFELSAKFFFQEDKISVLQFKQFAKEGLLKLKPQEKIYFIQTESLQPLNRLENFWSRVENEKKIENHPEESTYLLSKSLLLELLTLKSSFIRVHGGKRWEELNEFYDSLSKKNRVFDPLPGHLNQGLKDYQKIGIQWLVDLYRLNLGGILADEMGLGKTIQSLAFLEYLRTKNEMKYVLVLVPTSLTYNWFSEIQKFTPEIPATIFQTKKKESISQFMQTYPQGLVICTYGLFTENLDFFSSLNWNILIFDEAQNLKNIAAKRTHASRKLSCRFKLCLTGTPLENHLGEFYSLLDLVAPGSLGSLRQFKAQFVYPQSIDPQAIQFLKRKIHPLVLRRTKSKVLSELPEKIESTIRLPFEKKQEKIYRTIASSWKAKVKKSLVSHGSVKSQVIMLTALLRLRQICSDPSSIPNINYTQEPPKIGVLMQALEELIENGESALVFTQFLHMFHRIKKELKQREIRADFFYGGTTQTE